MKKLKILFVIDRIGYTDILNIPILSSLAKREGHHVDLIEFDPNPKKALKVMSIYQPDIVCYSVCSNVAIKYLNINRLLKEKFSFFSLFGGAHPTFFPEYIQEEGVDAICRGEADICFPLFLKHFKKEQMLKTPNFSFKISSKEIVTNQLSNLVEDIDGLPFPDRDIIYSKSYFLSNNPIKSFFAARGCPYHCSYCFNHAFNQEYRDKGEIIRLKSVDYFLNEIKQIAASYPLTFLKFNDDIFGINRNWLKEFSKKYPKEIGLPFFAFVRPNIVNENYAALLKVSGCFSVAIGVESGNEKIRSQVLNRKISNEEIKNARDILGNFDINVLTLNIIGLPGETEKEIFETIDFNRELKPDFADATIFQPYPGTQIYKFCKENGYLKEEDKGSSKNFFEMSTLNVDKTFKEKIFILQRLFSLATDHTVIRNITIFLVKLKISRILHPMLNFFFRAYYGFKIHRKIYALKIPLYLRIRAFLLLFSSQRRY